MMVGVSVPGANAVLVRRMLDVLVDFNLSYYIGEPRARSIEALGVRYRPDAPSDTIVLVSAPMLTRTASCGSAAAAMAAWYRARHGPAWTELVLERAVDGVAVWHVTAKLGARTWDPRNELLV